MKLIALLVLLAVCSTPAHAQTFKFKCFRLGGERGLMNLVVNSRSAKADIVGESWDDGFLGGAINPNYRPRGSASYVKYGTNLILEKALVAGGVELRDGSIGGFARAEGEAEGGFFQYKYICKR